ncbi:MAG: bifunctional tetrahydrofolate synthase/dihydrofolate synthase [Methylophilus sp.]
MNNLAKPKTLNEWLAYIEALHPKSIAMGLERVSTVASRLALKPSFKVITVAGTNGKGSTCAMLSHVYINAGYQVGIYTSPHLLRYNERVHINNQEISDQALCVAFQAVEDARKEVELTYFEMGTLAAMWHFMQLKLDVVILEVGLGGRLDAVNIFDADCAIVTNVDLDHMEYLGDTREKIGLEKAGVYRPNQISICGDHSPPSSLLAYAESIETDLKLANHDFHVKLKSNGWTYSDSNGELVFPELTLMGSFQVDNAASVIYAIRALASSLPVPVQVIVDTLPKVQLIGRFQYLHRRPDVIVDVAHNPQAALSLSESLKKIELSSSHSFQWIAVFAMLADKDIASVVNLLKNQVDVWYVAAIDHPRAASIDMLKSILLENGVSVPILAFSKVEDALNMAYKNMTKNDKIIVFGSFFTVAAALESLPMAEDAFDLIIES